MFSVLVCPVLLVLPISEMAGTEELDWAEPGLSSSLGPDLSVSDDLKIYFSSSVELSHWPDLIYAGVNAITTHQKTRKIRIIFLCLRLCFYGI